MNEQKTIVQSSVENYDKISALYHMKCDMVLQKICMIFLTSFVRILVQNICLPYDSDHMIVHLTCYGLSGEVRRSLACHRAKLHVMGLVLTIASFLVHKGIHFSETWLNEQRREKVVLFTVTLSLIHCFTLEKCVPFLVLGDHHLHRSNLAISKAH